MVCGALDFYLISEQLRQLFYTPSFLRAHVVTIGDGAHRSPDTEAGGTAKGVNVLGDESYGPVDQDRIDATRMVTVGSPNSRCVAGIISARVTGGPVGR